MADISMKKIIYILLAAAALAAVSCQKDPRLNGFDNLDQGLTLKFFCGDMTKATVDGADNENLVKQIDYFFFPVGADGKVAAETEWVYKGHFEPEAGHELDGTYTLIIEPGVLSKIFPNGNTKAVIFAVANYVDKYGAAVESPNMTIPSDETSPSEEKTWEYLHGLEVGETFFYDSGNPKFRLRWPRVMKPDNENLFFVMTGEKEVELKTSGRFAIDASGDDHLIPLERLASKVTVEFKYAEEIIDNKGVIWRPQPTHKDTRVYLSNGIEHATLGGPLTRTLKPDSDDQYATKPLGDGSRDIFEYAYDYIKDIPVVNGKQIAHYYTYPISMEEGDDNQPFLKLVLLWYGYETIDDEETLTKQKEVYYKIALPRNTISDPNRIYEYLVNVNAIDSDKEVLIEGDYIVKNWLTRDPILSNVATGRYISLDIPKSEYDMFTEKASIKFVSSSEVVVSKLQIYKMNYKPTTPVEVYYINGGPTSYQNPYNANTPDAQTDPINPLSKWVRIEGSNLVVEHHLNTNINSTSVDISPYYFVVTLHLKGESATTFDRTVTITQYPPIYVQTIETTRGNRTVFLNGTRHNWTTTANVYNRSNGESIGSIGQTEAAMETSRIKTIVSVSTLANLDLTKYNAQNVGTPVIGDPTITLADAYPPSLTLREGGRNVTYTWAENDVRDIVNNNKNLSEDYRYADPDKKNVIAPKFMVASGFGGCPSNKKNWVLNMERCATYQEDGYPAGRWRLPTEAEILFVYQLGAPTNEGGLALIDNPFFGQSHYFSNTGRKYYHGNFEATNTTVSNVVGGGSTRCVYDLWYWGDEPVATGAAAESWLGFQTSK